MRSRLLTKLRNDYILKLTVSALINPPLSLRQKEAEYSCDDLDEDHR